MLNETIFLIHIFIVVAALLIAFRIGKEALVAFLCVCWLLANLFVSKQILLGGFEVTACDVYALGGMLGISILQEFWGRKAASQSIWICFFILLLSTLMSLIHVHYSASPNDTMQIHFATLLSPAPRLMAASIFSFLLTGRIEIILFNFAKRFMSLSFAIRAAVVTALVMAFDTVLFSILGLYGAVASLTDIIVVSYGLKLIVLALLTPFLRFIKYFYRPSHDAVSI